MVFPDLDTLRPQAISKLMVYSNPATHGHGWHAGIDPSEDGGYNMLRHVLLLQIQGRKAKPWGQIIRYLFDPIKVAPGYAIEKLPKFLFPMECAAAGCDNIAAIPEKVKAGRLQGQLQCTSCRKSGSGTTRPWAQTEKVFTKALKCLWDSAPFTPENFNVLLDALALLSVYEDKPYTPQAQAWPGNDAIDSRLVISLLNWDGEKIIFGEQIQYFGGGAWRSGLANMPLGVFDESLEGKRLIVTEDTNATWDTVSLSELESYWRKSECQNAEI